jgi:hypothetical protein
VNAGLALFESESPGLGLPGTLGLGLDFLKLDRRNFIL